MTDRPDVDVVIPVYNMASVVLRAVESVRAQTFTSWRLTIVDDGSTDATAEVLRSVADDPRIRVVGQANAGPGAARNHGLRRAEAPLVAFLDADDEWLPGFLAATVAELAATPRAVAVCTAWSAPASRAEGNRRRVERGVAGLWSWSPGVAYSDLRARVDLMHTSAVLARRSELEGRGGFFGEAGCTYGEDSWLWLQVLLHREVLFDTRSLLRFHADAGSLSVGRAGAYPLPPALTAAPALLAAIEADRRPWTRAYLGWYAEFIVRRSVFERRLGQAVRAARIAVSELGTGRAAAAGTIATALRDAVRLALRRGRRLAAADR